MMFIGNTISFIQWLLKRMFGGVIYLYNKYDEFVVEEPLFSLMPTFLFSMVVLIVSALVMVFLGVATRVGLWIILTASAMCFVNYFRIILREQYRKFEAERERVFNVLKD